MFPRQARDDKTKLVFSLKRFHILIKIENRKSPNSVKAIN